MNVNRHGFKVTRCSHMQWLLVHVEKQTSWKRRILRVRFN